MVSPASAAPPLPLLVVGRHPWRLVIGVLAGLVAGWLATAACGLTGAAAALWAALVVLAGAAGALAWAWRLARDPAAGRDVVAGRLLLALLALSFAVRLAGLDQEIAVRSYLDEGTYERYARSTLAGELFPTSFVYPHPYFYLQSMALWLVDSLAPVSHRLVAALSRARQPIEVDWLALRLVSATLCALAVVPVFLAARRLAALAGRGAGFARVAGGLGALLLIFSPLYDGGAHLAICDAPSGAFAVLVVALCGRILAAQEAGQRPWALYALAGVAAAWAAGTKYPAGVVAVAIVAVAIAGMLTRRRLGAEILVAGGSSLLTFLLIMPALLVHADRVFSGGRDILYGVRQYAGGGWIGVQPASFAAYYGDNLVQSFGWLTLLAAPVGLLLAPVALRRRAAWLAVFPLVQLLLLGNMTMVVRRNLFPLLPVLALLLGPLLAVVLARLVEAVAGRWPRVPRQAIAAAAALLALAAPVGASLDQTLGFIRPSTRDLAAAWIRSHLPAGAVLVKESYTPDFRPNELAVRQTRFAARLAPEELRQPAHDFLLLASSAYQRFLDEEKTVKEHQQEYGERYRQIRAELPLVGVWEPGPRRLGPRLELYRILPLAPAAPLAAVRWTAAEAFVPDEAWRDDGAFRLPEATSWAMVKASLAAGVWTCHPEGQGSATVHVALRAVDARNELLASVAASPAPTLTLPPADETFLYLTAAPGTVLRALACNREP